MYDAARVLTGTSMCRQRSGRALMALVVLDMQVDSCRVNRCMTQIALDVSQIIRSRRTAYGRRLTLALGALMSKEWYSVKGLFRWYFKEGGRTDQIEERVVLFMAQSFDEALDMAEAEAKFYCQPDETANFNIEPIGWWHAYWIGEIPGNGVEVFSRGAKTNLKSKAFVQRYYPKSHNAGT
jgi:hypothetical protein